MFISHSYFSALTIILLTAFVCTFSFLLPFSAFAQGGPQLITSWNVDTYAPHWYEGRILPGNSSAITVSVSLLDRGTVVNLAGYFLRWYVNDTLVANEDRGRGVRSLSITAPQYGKTNVKVRVVVLDYKNIPELDAVLNIPVVAPEVVIDGSFIGVAKGMFVRAFQAHPFFFGVKRSDEIGFVWSAFNKNESPSENPSVLNLTFDSNLPLGASIPLSVQARTLSNVNEAAHANVVFTSQ